jgi:hypothetical protein
MHAGRYEPACPKLEAASKLYRGSGILLNLGDCYEHTGRLASAWTVFAEAATVAAGQGLREEKNEARRRQGLLEPRLSRMSIVVAHEVAGLVVQRDGVQLEPAAWGAAMPVDSGVHTIQAIAPGHATWETRVTVNEPGRTLTVQVPELIGSDQAPTPTTVPAAPAISLPDNTRKERGQESAQYWTARRLVGASVAAAGVVATGIAGALVLSAKSLDDRAANESGEAKHDDSASAVSRGNVATVVFGSGMAFVAVGALVWLSAPSPGAPAISTDGRHVFVRGTF